MAGAEASAGRRVERTADEVAQGVTHDPDGSDAVR
jgi:hypothetical protein